MTSLSLNMNEMVLILRAINEKKRMLELKHFESDDIEKKEIMIDLNRYKKIVKKIERNIRKEHKRGYSPIFEDIINDREKIV